jgi:hypothetical protein
VRGLGELHSWPRGWLAAGTRWALARAATSLPNLASRVRCTSSMSKLMLRERGECSLPYIIDL